MIRLPLLTERLLIRPVAPGDAEDLHRVYADPEVMRYLTDAPPASLEETRRWMRARMDRQERDGLSLWAVVERASGMVIGDCGVQREDCPGSSDLGLGFRFDRNWWGRGYATEAAGACVRASFAAFDDEPLFGVTKAENLRARRVLERVGMTLRGGVGCWEEAWLAYRVRPDDVTLVERTPLPEEFAALRRAVGWETMDRAGVEAGLRGGLYSVCLVRRGEVVGTGRIVGDGGIYFYLQDVVVLPELQGRGLGALLVDALLAWLDANAKRGAFVGLMAADGVAEFYERYGFRRRPDGRPGMFRVW